MGLEICSIHCRTKNRMSPFTCDKAMATVTKERDFHGNQAALK